MFKKILVANRGEIAVRIIRACRDMGIWTVALYDASDRGSLHVRLADECVELHSRLSYLDGEQILEFARETKCEAIHPGYCFLAEQPEFIRACEESGIVFIGPPSQVAETVRNKIGMQELVREAGFATPLHSEISFHEEDWELLEATARDLGYPLVVKPCSGGRGRAARFIRSAGNLAPSVRSAYAEARIVYGDDRLYLEKAIQSVHYIDVQILGDKYGNILHLGERNGSMQRNNQKLIVEAPASCLTPEQREEVLQIALNIARLVNYQNIGTVEFLMDAQGRFYFTEIKARIQVEHSVTEMVYGVDLVREQIELAAGKKLDKRQEDFALRGWSLSCRINAEDPWNNFLPSPGRLQRFRLPGGPNVRIDTYAYSGCEVPLRYDPMLGKVIVWGENREECIRRMRRTLQDFHINGVHTNLPLHQRVLEEADFISGQYTTEFLRRRLLHREGPSEDLRDLAVAAAIAYLTRYQAKQPLVPDRLQSGWHRSGRVLG